MWRDGSQLRSDISDGQLASRGPQVALPVATMPVSPGGEQTREYGAYSATMSKFIKQKQPFSFLHTT